jgi:hypothetical protein
MAEICIENSNIALVFSLSYNTLNMQAAEKERNIERVFR